jgi:hypothetical protein
MMIKSQSSFIGSLGTKVESRSRITTRGTGLIPIKGFGLVLRHAVPFAVCQAYNQH